MSFQTKTNEILLLEDNATSAERRSLPGVGAGEAAATVTVRVHRLSGDRRSVVARATYEAGSMRSKNGARIELVGQLLRRAVARSVKPIIVAGTSYGSAASFLALLCDDSLPFVVQIRPSTQITLAAREGAAMPASRALSRAEWRQVTATLPDGTRMACTAAKLAKVEVPGCTAQLFAAQIGGIDGVHRGTIIGLSSLDVGLTSLVELAAHSRWIRREIRNQKRASAPCVSVERFGIASMITARANIALARRQDEQGQTGCAAEPARRGVLQNAGAVLNVVELFSGAGGMGLGFLLGGGSKKRYRIVFSGEANPIFVQTLRANHQKYERLVGQISDGRTPVELKSVDLREKRVLENAVAVAKESGGAHFLIGGPPCQGFSMANRNSWSPDNPNNELVNVFIKYILKLRPLGFLMENVQGILWTPGANGTVSVVDAIEWRLKAAGYVLFPKLLDAVWYGVPQHRTRFFLMGLHRDLGYAADDFGKWGPFPQPTHGPQKHRFVTVRQAISDLPRIGNGYSSEEIKYSGESNGDSRDNEFLRYVRSGAAEEIIFDHVTSKHADYVIDRYRKIPAGGNWEDIREELSNYTEVTRTHSNIYRRLRWGEPSITIGHYRKSMLVHPSQHRGLSLREAARLQSFPDWFRFAGTADGATGGLVHKQQQLANAVCPLVTKAIAEFIRGL